MVTKKYKISLQSLARYAELFPSMTILDFIELILNIVPTPSTTPIMAIRKVTIILHNIIFYHYFNINSIKSNTVIPG